MPLIRSRITHWTCTDGKEFVEFAKAARYEHELQTKSFFGVMFTSVEGISPETAAMLSDLVWRRRAAVARMLTKSQTALKREAKPADVEVKPS
jgi:hypothetical protein